MYLLLREISKLRLMKYVSGFIIFVFGGEVTPLPLVSICYIFILFSLLTEKSMNQHDMSQCNKKFCKFIFIGVTLKTDS